MYYPYLRSKQNEMLALREIAQSTTIRYSHIMPIIEPVRDLLTLDKTVEALEKVDIPSQDEIQIDEQLVLTNGDPELEMYGKYRKTDNVVKITYIKRR